MEKWKKGLKLIKYSYSYQKKGDRYLGIFFIVMGILLLLASSWDETFLMAGVLWLVMGPITGIQMSNSLLYSHMIEASGKRKLLDIILPNVWTLVGTLFGYILMVIVLAMTGGFSTEVPQGYIFTLIRTSFMVAILIVMVGMSGKMYWQGVFICSGLTMISFIVGFLWERGYEKSGGEPISMITAILFFLAVMLVGVGISCLIRVLLYRCPVVRGQIGKQMLKSM